MSVFFVRHNENSKVCSQKHWLILFKRSKLVSKINKSRKLWGQSVFFFVPCLRLAAKLQWNKGEMRKTVYSQMQYVQLIIQLRMSTLSFIVNIFFFFFFFTFGSQIIQSVSQQAQRRTRPTFHDWKHHKVTNSAGGKGQSNRNRSLDVTWIHAKALRLFPCKANYRAHLLLKNKVCYFFNPKVISSLLWNPKPCQEHVKKYKGGSEQL